MELIDGVDSEVQDSRPFVQLIGVLSAAFDDLVWSRNVDEINVAAATALSALEGLARSLGSV